MLLSEENSLGRVLLTVQACTKQASAEGHSRRTSSTSSVRGTSAVFSYLCIIHLTVTQSWLLDENMGRASV